MADIAVSNNQQQDLKAVMEIHPPLGLSKHRRGKGPGTCCDVRPSSRRLLAAREDGNRCKRADASLTGAGSRPAPASSGQVWPALLKTDGKGIFQTPN